MSTYISPGRVQPQPLKVPYAESGTNPINRLIIPLRLCCKSIGGEI